MKTLKNLSKEYSIESGIIGLIYVLIIIGMTFTILYILKKQSIKAAELPEKELSVLEEVNIESTAPSDNEIVEVIINCPKDIDVQVYVNEVEETTMTTAINNIITTTVTTTEVVQTQTETIDNNVYIVYKPSTKFIHKNTCKWFDNTCYKIDSLEGLSYKYCTDCNPDLHYFALKNNIVVDENNNTSSISNLLGNFKITGYVDTGNATASGVYPKSNHTVAMNKSQMHELGLKYGDTIYIEDLGEFTIEDCGCNWEVVDVFCDSVSECYKITSYKDVYLT